MSVLYWTRIRASPGCQDRGEPTDDRHLSDLVELWFGRHGQSLRDGEARKSKLLTVCHSLGDPLAVNFTARDFAAYREARLSGDITDRRAINQEKQGVTPNTVNREHAYLRAVFNELKRLGEWQGGKPPSMVCEPTRWPRPSWLSSTLMNSSAC